MASRGKDKGLGEWLDNQDVCQILNISPRTLQTLRQNGTLAYSQIEHKTYYKPEDVERIIPLVEIRKNDTHPYGCYQRKGGGIWTNWSCHTMLVWNECWRAWKRYWHCIRMSRATIVLCLMVSDTWRIGRPQHPHTGRPNHRRTIRVVTSEYHGVLRTMYGMRQSTACHFLYWQWTIRFFVFSSDMLKIFAYFAG